ncbi:MAG TPA: hypothetical protein VE978_10935, partial [Chitinophagales bacterium]|nr:hypothetical protein [Chitinophagales bacterium]
MRTLSQYCCCCFLSILPLMAHTQDFKTDSLLSAISKATDDSGKINLMLTLSHNFWQHAKMSSALEYSQRASALGEDLALKNEIVSMKKSFQNNGLSNASRKPDSMKEITDRLSKIEEQQKKLDIAVKEYNRRSFSFADDQLKEAQQENERLALRQQAELQHLADERTRRNWIVSGAVIIFTLLSVVFILIYHRRQAKSKLEVNQL